MLQTKCGTTNYMAPEISEHSTYNESVDVFALGVVLFMMLTAQEPFREANDTHFRRF